MTSSLPGAQRTAGKRSQPLVKHFLKNEDWNSHRRKPISRISRMALTFSGRTSANTTENCSSNPPRRISKRFLDKVREVIKANKTSHGWTSDYATQPGHPRMGATITSMCAVSEPLRNVDHAIFQALWRWAKRRHPNKGTHDGLKRNTSRPSAGETGFSRVKSLEEGDKPKIIQLALGARTPIRRHIKIKGEANPYDPAWEVYFEQRLGVKMADDLRGQEQTAPPVERAKWSLPCLPTENHQAHRMAQPSHHLAIQGRQ